jgi:ElaB/YqjD/DUF883 family membrane-anchored ribosome-binding protein
MPDTGRSRGSSGFWLPWPGALTGFFYCDTLARRQRNIPSSRPLLIAHPEIWTRILLAHQRTSEMTSATQTFRQAANSPAGRQAAETTKSIGEEVSEFAGDVGRMASKQYGRAQDMAVDAFDETHAAIRRNPLLSLGIALGIGFLLGVLTSVRR